MQYITVLLMAVSLALDALAVSVSSGITVKNFNRKNALVLGLYFGGFQFFMPVLGWILSNSVEQYIEAYDHYIAFGLLAVIGGKMIFDSFSKEEDNKESNKLTHKKMILLAIATSIDALAVGVTIKTTLADMNVFAAAAIIGIVAFAFSVVGGMFGKKIGEKFEKRATLVGGIVLVAIGLKTLVEHLFI